MTITVLGFPESPPLDTNWANWSAAPADNGVHSLVSAGFEQAQQHADAAILTANQLIGSLAAAGGALSGIAPIVLTSSSVGSISVSPFTDIGGVSIQDFTANGSVDTATLTGVVTVGNVSSPSPAVFVEAPYSSVYLNDLRSQLDSWVLEKATGILPAVEQAIWDRGRAREAVASNRKAQEAVRSFSIRGFTKPQGSLSVELAAAVQEAQNNDITSSREVMIKQADLEQTNRRFAFEQAWKIEEGMIAYLNQQMSRAVDMVKAIQVFASSILQQQVALQGVIVQAEAAAINAEAQVVSANVGATAHVQSANVGAQAQVQSANVGAQAQVQSANVGAEAHVQAANVGAEAQVASANLSAQAQLQIANAQQLIQKATVLIEALKAGAQVAGQLAASAMASVNMSGSLGATTSNSASNTSSNTGSSSTQVSLHSAVTNNNSTTQSESRSGSF